ncbi:MAG: Crp/Fnr family transcriptional regulator [Clostridia bacterium]|nr:Crp/Fnr family transcriptional regulator [Clostridia bacterium]MBQ2517633.1 Crp/Fnr family transcriptional regulator [Clostridia bacterium]MBQ4341132.1 Crp/Fnr family transcriptional regulator [Clostridia bacterium]MBR6428804.1 Crp/Fnr family transcriptional regulator [Clostridia bacterium]
MSDPAAYLERLPFWEHLDAGERAFALRNTGLRRAAKGSLIYSRDCACVGLVYVVSGAVRVYSLSPEGREITLLRLGEGEPCVLSAACVVDRISFDTHMETETDSVLLVLNAEAFRTITDGNIYARCFMYEQAAQSFSTVMRTMESILFDRFDSRLAGFLLEEAERTGSNALRLTQSMVAEKVNSAREVVARQLKSFAKQGFVKTERGIITVADAEGLRGIVRK